MTIHMEQESLLRVMERPLPHSQPQPSHSQSHPPSSQGEEFVLVDFRNTFKSNDCAVEKLRHSTYDDEDSVFTLSTASLSDSDSEVERSVSFADDVVTEEWTRPYTPKEEVSKLFYSTEETQRFRQEYRLERKLLNELSADPESVSIANPDLDEVAATSTHPSVRHRISRVVILHNDKLETFFNPDHSPVEKKVVPSGDDFFDNDSFWSGSITWY